MRYLGKGLSHTGLRPNNEDRFHVDDERGLWLVADGMGGHEGGEVAANLAIELIRDFYERVGDQDDAALDEDLAHTRMDLAFRIAHREVTRVSVQGLTGMGSTLVALRRRGDQMLVAHCGDSRAYRYRDARLTPLTRDHSLLNELEAAGFGGIPEVERMTHVITRGIGVDEQGHPDLQTTDIRTGDRFLMCTDGLSNVVSDGRIAAIMATFPIRSVVAALVTEALRSGARDNVTALVVEVSD